MAESQDWAFPAELQPSADELAFDLRGALDAVVSLRSDVPEDAFTASILGTERSGSGVVIRDDGLILTIGYLITEADSIWVGANDGTVVAGHPLAYDVATGFGLVQPLGRIGAPALPRGTSSGATVGEDVVVIASGGRAHALKARLVAKRAKNGAEPLTFAMTFPFSTHNYQLRFWMAAGGVDPDEDVRLVVLPPPYMVDSLANGHVDAFCVGAPWNSIAVDKGVGHILHFASDILARAAEKVLAVRQTWAEKNPEILASLVRALARAAEYVEQPQNRAEVARLLAQPERVGVDADVIRRTLDGRMKISPDGAIRESSRYLLVGREEAARPEPVQAAWLYAQMVRWGQTPFSPEALKAAMAVFRADLYDAVLRRKGSAAAPASLGAFAGPDFDPADVTGFLAAFEIGRRMP